MIFFLLNRFKTADAHQKHFKKQGKYKCDVCFQLFCSNKALENHKTDCAGIAEEIDVIETKPTFVECDFDYKVTAELLPQPMTGLETEQEKNQDGEPEPEQKLEPEFESEPEHEQKQISFSVNAVGYTMTPLRIQMDIDETLESTRIRNSFPKDDSNRQYYCYLCDRQYVKRLLFFSLNNIKILFISSQIQEIPIVKISHGRSHIAS